ncbi:hypothetical protein AB0B40_26780 [Streptomyces sp. NPDC042638]|uniref:hypothetical protein n=1 Tax=Streptomyces sp. NPDC042638 TaxID=3154333 RepID=UPI0033C1A76D
MNSPPTPRALWRVVPHESPALLLGRYLSALDVLCAEEERRLHLRMFHGVARLAHRFVVFKPHLGRLTPYQNSDRIPVAIVDTLLPDVDDASAVHSWSLTRSMEEHQELADLIAAVGFGRQPDLHPRLRATAERHLASHADDPVRRYFHRRRL